MTEGRKKIVIVPGWTYSEEKMLPLCETLRKNNYEVDLLKVPGLTGEALQEAWTLVDYEKWLEKEIKERTKAGGKIVLLGHSNGGRIILQFLSIKSEQKAKVEKVILIGSAGVKDRKWYKVLKRDLVGLGAKIGGRLKKNPRARRWLYKLLRERDYYQATTVMKKTMANLIGGDLREKLSTISEQTLLIWGTEDKMTPLYLGREMAEKMPRATLKIIKGARHVPQFTHKEETMELIKEFLSIREKKEGENGEV